MTNVRRFGPVVALAGCVVLALAVVEPSILTSTIRSPRGLALIVAISAAASAAARVVRSRWGKGAGRLTLLAALGLSGLLLVAPALRQKTLNEPLPVESAAALTAGSGLLATSTTTAAVPAPAPEAAPITLPSTPTTAPRFNGPNSAPTTIATPTTTTTTTAAAPTDPQRLTTGRLAGIGHDASGGVSVYRLGDGSSVVRFEEVDIRGAPDPVLYLVPGSDRRSRDGGVRVGPLRATKGSFNQAVPVEFDFDQPFTVFVWCDRFVTPIANADQRRL